MDSLTHAVRTAVINAAAVRLNFLFVVRIFLGKRALNLGFQSLKFSFSLLSLSPKSLWEDEHNDEFLSCPSLFDLGNFLCPSNGQY